eukprot:5131577-Alexandrium_andersonii.AAC.1
MSPASKPAGRNIQSVHTDAATSSVPALNTWRRPMLPNDPRQGPRIVGQRAANSLTKYVRRHAQAC